MDKNGKDEAEETLLRLLANPTAVRHLSEDRCQRAAVRCRRRAEAAKDEIGKATWLTFAKEWLKLADEAEQSNGRVRPLRPGGWGHGMSAAGKTDAASAAFAADGLRSPAHAAAGLFTRGDYRL